MSLLITQLYSRIFQAEPHHVKLLILLHSSFLGTKCRFKNGFINVQLNS